MNLPAHEDVNLMYDDGVKNDRYYLMGIDESHVVFPFQYDLCIFRSMFNHTDISSIIKKMNLDIIWSRDFSKAYKNIFCLNNVVSITY